MDVLLAAHAYWSAPVRNSETNCTRIAAQSQHYALAVVKRESSVSIVATTEDKTDESSDCGTERVT
jgi:hypothetical protein